MGETGLSITNHLSLDSLHNEKLFIRRYISLPGEKEQKPLFSDSGEALSWTLSVSLMRPERSSMDRRLFLFSPPSVLLDVHYGPDDRKGFKLNTAPGPRDRAMKVLSP